MPEIKDSENLLYLRNMGNTTTAQTADLVLDTIHQDMKKRKSPQSYSSTATEAFNISKKYISR